MTWGYTQYILASTLIHTAEVNTLLRNVPAENCMTGKEVTAEILVTSDFNISCGVTH